MELKLENMTDYDELSYFKSYHFGIETPQWQRASVSDLLFKSYHFGIETRHPTSKTALMSSLNRTILELKQLIEINSNES